jgi:hypothetical protein
VRRITFTRRGIRKACIELVTPTKLPFQCTECRRRWSVTVTSEGLPLRWWLCPNRCNRPSLWHDL